jgi:transaldolase/glucose-6-phosphate isomerase
MENTIRRNLALGQSTWVDYISRDMLVNGELDRLVRDGVTGLTSNPTIFEKAISGSTDYDEALAALSREGKSPTQIFEALAVEDIRAAAQALRSVYDAAGGRDGFVSLEVAPTLAYDTEGTVRDARRLWSAVGEPNVMIKVPGTPEGLPAITQLIGEGINVNVTLIFALDSYRRVMDAYVSGLQALAQRGGELGRVASVASFFVSRVDTAVDNALEKTGADASLQGKAAVANAQAAYALFKERFARDDFAALQAQGAQVQRPLWASTSTKNPAYPDTLYIDNLIGPYSVNTMPPDTLQATLDHGVSALTLEGTEREAHNTLAALKDAGVDMDAVTDKLLSDGVDAFAGSYRQLLDSIEAKCGLLAQARS